MDHEFTASEKTWLCSFLSNGDHKSLQRLHERYNILKYDLNNWRAWRGEGIELVDSDSVLDELSTHKVLQWMNDQARLRTESCQLFDRKAFESLMEREMCETSERRRYRAVMVYMAKYPDNHHSNA